MLNLNSNMLFGKLNNSKLQAVNNNNFINSNKVGFKGSPDKDEFKLSYCQMPPATAMKLSYNGTIGILNDLLGEEKVQEVIDATKSGKVIKSNIVNQKTSHWLQTGKMIGMVPRVAESYLGMVKYAMTFPEDTIHLLPTFISGNKDTECGYSIKTWKMDPELMDPELTKRGFDTPEKQLLFAINMMHALGKKVGFDAIPHTNRFSEMTLASPEYFEWIKVDRKTDTQEYPYLNKDDSKPTRNLANEVKDLIKEFLIKEGKTKEEVDKLYSGDLTENERIDIIFGQNENEATKEATREKLMKFLIEKGYDTISVANDPPYRPVQYDGMQQEGRYNWSKYKVPNKEGRKIQIFSDITPYSLYETNNDGTINIEKPKKEVWDYFSQNLADLQKQYGFDFMRVDMAHIQLDYSGYLEKGENYKGQEFWAYVKDYIQEKNNMPSFASFGEEFLAPRPGFPSNPQLNPMVTAERKKFDTVLGNAQYENNLDKFWDKIKGYNMLGKNFKPSVTISAADTDSKSKVHLYNNPIALQIKEFAALFLNMPSYMAMGFETREIEPENKNEFTKPFIKKSDKSYEWGENYYFYGPLSKMRKAYDQLKGVIQNQAHWWLNADNNKIKSWMYLDKTNENKPSYLFVVNSNPDLNATETASIENPLNALNDKTAKSISLVPVMSTNQKPNKLESQIVYKGNNIKVTNMAPGEGRIYKVISN